MCWWNGPCFDISVDTEKLTSAILNFPELEKTRTRKEKLEMVRKLSHRVGVSTAISCYQKLILLFLSFDENTKNIFCLLNNVV